VAAVVALGGTQPSGGVSSSRSAMCLHRLWDGVRERHPALSFARIAQSCVARVRDDAGHTGPAGGPGEKGTRGPLPRDVSDDEQRRRLEGEGRRGTMRQWGETEGVVRGATRRPWVWERVTGTTLTLVGVAGVGLLTWTITGAVPLSDTRLTLAALLVDAALCILIVRVDQAIKKQRRVERVENEERRRRLRRRPYSVVAEAEAVLAHAQGRRET